MKVTINGFGRIGRLVVRALLENREAARDIQITHINSPGPASTAAHLLNYDTTHGVLSQPVKYDEDWLDFGLGKIPYTRYRSPEEWDAYRGTVLLECSGKFTKEGKATPYITGGARGVLISAPAPGADATIVFGVNDRKLTPKTRIVSNASCTTNCLAPVLDAVMGLKIQYGSMTTVHAYTQDQRMQDSSHPSDLRRARAGAQNVVPTTTGAAKAIDRIFPQLSGKLFGMAIRVPVLNVSLIDLTLSFEVAPHEGEINRLLKAYHNAHPHILGYTEKPLVSSDFIHRSESSIIDGSLVHTCGSMARIITWYDNEWGFANRMLDTARAMDRVLPQT